MALSWFTAKSGSLPLAAPAHKTSSISRGLQGAASRSAALPRPFSDMGTGILRAPKLVLSDAERVRLDESPDATFYATPRLMQHADEPWLDALTRIYTHILPPTPRVLELCASAHSHLPAALKPRLLVGQGMNSAELAANPDLHQRFVQDLNQQPLLLEQVDASYDVVLCVNGIQYLTQPETVVAEASRVLQAGGLLVVAFGPHCFREKAVAGWLSRDMQERVQLLTKVIQANGFDTPTVLDSPAAAALAQHTAQAQSNGASTAQSSQPAAAAAAADNAPGPSSSRGGSSADLQLRVLVARKSSDWTAGAAEADTPGVEMRPDNVQTWFSKPGLAGLAEAAAGGSQQQSGSAQQQQQQQQQSPASQPVTSSGSIPQPTGPSLQGSQVHPSPEEAAACGTGGVGAAATSLTGGAVNARLLEQWHAAYASLVVDAVDLGIPRSVIPAVSADASPAELQQAVQHLQDMMASFLSAGL